MWTYLLLVILSALLTVKLVNLCLYWRRRGLPYESFPHSLYRTLWLFTTRVIPDVYHDVVKTYGKVYGSYKAFTPTLVVADADIAKDVLIKQFSSFFGRTFEFTTGDALWDNTITHLPYEQWKTVRTVMGYTFTTSKMKGMVPKIDKIASRYADELVRISKSNENEVTLRSLVRGFAMDAIVAVSFGIDVNTLENPDNDFVKHNTKLFKTSISLFFAFCFPNAYRYIPFLEFPPKTAMQFFGNIGKRIIAEKRKNLDEVIANGTADILDLHLIAQREDPKNHLTDELLASQAFIFFAAGIDPMMIALQTCTYFLALNPDIQERVVDEIHDTMNERTTVQYEDVHKMKLLEACILESLRLMPVSIVIDRVAVEDTEVAGIPIEKGTVVEFPVAPLHNDPQYFPEPEKFIPDRFLKDGNVSAETASFLTFGDGPKSCIGRRLAIMTMQTVLAKILIQIKFESCEKTPIPFKLRPGFEFTNPFLTPLVLRLTPRV